MKPLSRHIKQLSHSLSLSVLVISGNIDHDSDLRSPGTGDFTAAAADRGSGRNTACRSQWSRFLCDLGWVATAKASPSFVSDLHQPSPTAAVFASRHQRAAWAFFYGRCCARAFFYSPCCAWVMTLARPAFVSGMPTMGKRDTSLLKIFM